MPPFKSSAQFTQLVLLKSSISAEFSPGTPWATPQHRCSNLQPMGPAPLCWPTPALVLVLTSGPCLLPCLVHLATQPAPSQYP